MGRRAICIHCAEAPSSVALVTRQTRTCPVERGAADLGPGAVRVGLTGRRGRTTVPTLICVDSEIGEITAKLSAAAIGVETTYSVAQAATRWSALGGSGQTWTADLGGSTLRVGATSLLRLHVRSGHIFPSCRVHVGTWRHIDARRHVDRRRGIGRAEIFDGRIDGRGEVD